MEIPETRYAKTADGVHIGYQVVGDGPGDFVYMTPWFSHLELNWEEPLYARFLQRIASFSRLILFDRRGNGLSDPVPLDAPPLLEARMDDALAVMDAVGSERAVIYGASESGALAMLFAATYPERTVGLITIGASAREAWAPDYPWGESLERRDEDLAFVEAHWGTERFVREEWGMDDERLIEWLATLSRRAMSPGAAVAYSRMMWDIDVRDTLSSIHVPTLVLHREGDVTESTLYLAEHIPGAELVELPGTEHVPYLGDQDSITRELARFFRSVHDEEAELDRVLATVLFTDIVDSTKKASELGDREWRVLVERHHAAVRGLLARYRGTEVDTAGDGFFATFDGPARAIRCAQAIGQAVGPLGIEIRAGLHTGECETIDGKVGGIAVVIGARVGALARASQILVSQTVKDLVAGSRFTFEDAGEHELKGVPDRWRLYRVASEA